MAWKSTPCFPTTIPIMRQTGRSWHARWICLEHIARTLPQREYDLSAYNVEGFTPGLGSIRGTADFSAGSIGVFPPRLHSELDFEMLHVRTDGARSDEHVEVWLDTVRPDIEPIKLRTTAD